MEKRQEIILETIIREHIKTACPVSSGALVKKYDMDISPATVRNEMAGLERNGYIVQPHTSAGRVPSDRAYVWYLDKVKNEESEHDFSDLDDRLDLANEYSFKEVAKEMSQLSGNAVFWAFHKHNLFYTGISNLFQQPEFSRINVIHDISAVIDRLDDMINGILEETELGVHTKVGANNPFGSMFGSVFAKYDLDSKRGMFGVLGPIRMDYPKIISLVEHINKKLTKQYE